MTKYPTPVVHDVTTTETLKLTPLKKRLLRMCLQRECTEMLYDTVEEARPTQDEDGEPINDLDPYETSREEIGDLECAGLLDHDEDGMASFGYSTTTAKGREALDKDLDEVTYEAD